MPDFDGLDDLSCDLADLSCDSTDAKSSEIDIIGYTLSEAKKKLVPMDICIISVEVIAQPRDKTNDYNEDYRVIKQELLDKSRIKVWVCKG